ERTVADGWARSGRQGHAVHESLGEPARDRGQVQADARRVRTQGGIVWMALAMMVQTRRGLGGEGTEQRDMALRRRVIECVRRGAAPRPWLFCTDGVVSYIRAIRETFRAPVHTGPGARLVMVSFTYMRSEADLTLYGPTQRAAIVAWTKLCVLDDAASEDDRRPRPLGGSVGSGCAAGRQSG